MRTSLVALTLAAATAALPAAAQTLPAAGASTQRPPNEQVIEPAVPRRDVRVPKIPSNDFIAGAFIGTYSSENFGASMVYGARLGYHITEDFFVEGVYGTTTVTDESFRQILPGGIFPKQEEKLDYYNLSVGYNILPGEVFFGSRWAKASALYLIAGVGSTRLLEQSKQTVNFGLGYRMFMKDWAAIQVDVRDHMYSLDLLGTRRSTTNLEFTAGATFFF
ncbi:MAG: outer membrane beta-barrel domain-containing protein [Burkholderiaceae bacterium]